MADALTQAIRIAASGIEAFGERLQVISTNIANANTTAMTPGGNPYARQEILFAQKFDKAMGVNMLTVQGVVPDSTPFTEKYAPGHPAADDKGFIKNPNVNPVIEMSDLVEAHRSRERIMRAYQMGTELQRMTIKSMGS